MRCLLSLWVICSRMLWYSNLPCFDVNGVTSENRDENALIKACYWEGRLIPCAAIFSPIPTDRGMCCAFNMKSFDEIFVGKKFVNLAKELQEDDKNSAFMDAKLPDWYSQGGMSAQPGDYIGKINLV